MGRSTIERQINNILYSKQAFGESRHEAKKELKEALGDDYKFGMTDDKIHSYASFDTYQKACQRFGAWLIAEKGINKRTNIQDCKQYAAEYIKSRLDDGVSVWTAKMERSALGKLYGETIEIEMPKRDIKKITRSRGPKKGDVHFSVKNNRDLIDIAIATGGRRADIAKMKPSDFYYDDKGNLWVKINESKGGRNRVSPVLPQYKERVEEILKQHPADKHIFKTIHAQADIHSFRGEYARALYRAVSTDKDFKDAVLDAYPARHEYKTVKDPKTGERVTKEISGQNITTRQGKGSQTFKRDDVYCVSQALGHNRLDVSITHYFK